MATIEPKTEFMGTYAVRITWENMHNGDIGVPANVPDYADRSFQVKGAFGVGGSLAIKGSNDGSTFAPLSDLRGNDLAITSARIEQIEDFTYAITPQVTAGDGSTDLTVIMFARRGA